MPEPHLRAADADRAEVAAALGGHLTAGRLTVDEYDERLTRTYAARTHGELAELTTDLPALEPAAVPGRVDPTHRDHPAHGSGHGSADLRAAWAAWARTAVLVTGIWLVSLIASTGWVYPWPLWVVGPWGVVLLARSLGSGPHGGRDRRRPG